MEFLTDFILFLGIPITIIIVLLLIFSVTITRSEQQDDDFLDTGSNYPKEKDSKRGYNEALAKNQLEEQKLLFSSILELVRNYEDKPFKKAKK